MKINRLLFFLFFLNLYAVNSLTAQWEQTKGMQGGQIECFASSGSFVYAGTNGGGLYRSSDNGNNWIVINKGFEFNYPISLTASGSNVFAGTVQGAFYSSDNGNNWKPINNGLPDGFTRISIFGTKMFAGTQNGVFISSNSGTTWIPSDSALKQTRITSFAAIGDLVFAGTEYNGIYRSTDGGITWNPANSGLTEGNVRCLAVAGSNLFASIDSKGVYISSDLGATWTLTNLQTSFVNSLIPIGTTLFAAVNGRILCSHDYWDSWTDITNDIPWRYYVRTLGNNGSTIFTGSFKGGIYKSNNEGELWQSSNNGLQNVHVYSLAFRGFDSFAGTDNGEIYHSSDSGLNWKKIGQTEGYVNALEVRKTGLFAAVGSVMGGDGLRLFSKDDSGWHEVKTFIPGLRINSLAGTSSCFYASSEGVYHSTDLGAIWTYSRKGLGNFSIISMTTMGPYVIAGSNGFGVYRSSDNGMTFNAINVGMDGPPGHVYVNDLAISGTKLFAATSIGVYLSSNYGTTWNRVNNGITTDYINTLAVYGTSIFAGTRFNGVFHTSDYGLTWNPLNDSLWNKNVHKLGINNGYLYAGTEGAGVWRYPLYSLPLQAEETSNTLPRNYSLDQNYPNPFNPSTKIRFSLPENASVKLIVYDLLGREITCLVNGELNSGYHEVTFNAGNLTSGIYFYRLSAPKFSAVRKLMFIK